MKYFIVTIAVVIAALIYYTYFYKPLKANNSTLVSVLQLGDLPDQVCPEKAWLLVTDASSSKTVVDRAVPVRECDTVLIRSYLPSIPGEFNVFVKLPGSLASSAIVNTPIQQSLRIPVRLGDVTNDNIIDSNDEKLVVDSMYSVGGAADVNNDGKVSVEDVVLVRLNKGVGVERVDKKQWSQPR